MEIRKGALVARDPTGYEDITGEEVLDQKEIDALRDEVLHKWRITGQLLLTVITCSIGAIVQGWDQTGTNGATVEFPEAYDIGGESIRDKLLVGLVNAAPYLGTAFFGCWMSDPINNRFGRRGTIFFSANFCLWPVIASSFCNTWQQLLACRLLLGMGMGTKASTSEFLQPCCALKLVSALVLFCYVVLTCLQFRSMPPKTHLLLSVAPSSWVGRCGQLSASSWELAQTWPSSTSAQNHGAISSALRLFLRCLSPS